MKKEKNNNNNNKKTQGKSLSSDGVECRDHSGYGLTQVRFLGVGKSDRGPQGTPTGVCDPKNGPDQTPQPKLSPPQPELWVPQLNLSTDSA